MSALDVPRRLRCRPRFHEGARSAIDQLGLGERNDHDDHHRAIGWGWRWGDDDHDDHRWTTSIDQHHDGRADHSANDESSSSTNNSDESAHISDESAHNSDESARVSRVSRAARVSRASRASRATRTLIR